MKSVTLNKPGLRKIQQGHVWLSFNDVLGRPRVDSGVVEIWSDARKPLGMAFLSEGTGYYLRIFSHKVEKVDKSYWRKKIMAAYAER